MIAGEVLATLDVRHAENAVREQAAAELLRAAQREAEARGVRVESRASATQAAFPMDAALAAQLCDAAKRGGYPARALVSGAGHDAMIVGRRVPAAMLFVRNPDGLSHHPHEVVLAEDVEAGLATGMELLRGMSVARGDAACGELGMHRVGVEDVHA